MLLSSLLMKHKMLGLSDSFYTDALGKLGYTKELSEKRIKIYDNFADSLTRVFNRNWSEETYTIIAGSRGEGLAVCWNSDIDIIVVQPAVKCFETYPTSESVEVKNYAATFQLDLDNVPDGYTKLQLRQNKTYSRKGPGSYYNIVYRIKQSLAENKYLKSGLRLIETVERIYGGNRKTDGWLSEHYQFDEINGPAQPRRYPLPFPNKYLSVDFVQAFPCSYPSLFDELSKRERKYGWPSTDVLKAVKETDVYVVSVGHSGSEEKSLQWRISSTPAERLLVRTFNESQIKLYAAMKMLVKHELKPICSNITSYIVKNLLFWVFEKQSGVFQDEEFADVLLKALKYLKECVILGCLPNYIIPTRNLLEEKILEEEKRDLIAHLDVLINEGSSALLRCPVIKNMLNSSAEDLKEGLLFRELVDQVMLAFLSLEPSIFDEIEHAFYLAKEPGELITIYCSRVLTVIRESDPFQYFGLLRTLAGIDIISLMFKGLKLGYDERWID